MKSIILNSRSKRPNVLFRFYEDGTVEAFKNDKGKMMLMTCVPIEKTDTQWNYDNKVIGNKVFVPFVEIHKGINDEPNYWCSVDVYNKYGICVGGDRHPLVNWDEIKKEEQ